MKKTTQFKQLITAPEILILPGAHDALSAKIVERAGFKAVTMGGYPASAALLGKPDVNLLTMTEMVNHARNMAEAVDIPLFVDGDTGHGNVTNVIRTVREFEKAGVAGLFIEDQVSPKRCGHMEGKQVIPADEMIAKIKAATDARQDPDLMIMARTDARAVYGLDEAIDRGNRCREAGADIIFVEAPVDESELRRIASELDAPTLANVVEGGKTPAFSAREFEEMGFAVVAFPLSTIYASARAVTELMAELFQQGTTLGYADRMTVFNDFNKLVGLEEVRETERRYYQSIVDDHSKQ
jgi:carboxyvinyl-carboxyphosphonate phosphorylmutase